MGMIQTALEDLVTSLGGEASGIYKEYPLQMIDRITMPYLTLSYRELNMGTAIRTSVGRQYPLQMNLQFCVYGAADATSASLMSALEQMLLEPMLDSRYRVEQLKIGETKFINEIERMSLRGEICISGQIYRREVQ